ncbi:MAG: ATP-binding protein [Gordonibacter sp.]
MMQDRPRNPFTPSFGQIPLHMAGREMVIDELLRAFDNGSGDPNLSTILIGARGTGKTALMSLLAHEAQGRGWLSVNVSALPGMLNDIVQQVRHVSRDAVDKPGGMRLKGVGIPQVLDIEWEREPQELPNWRTLMSEILEELNKRDTGLLITIDEVRGDFDELIQLIAIHQHFVREERKVALLMAGLPGEVSSLLQDKSVSFFRRACQRHLGRIDDFEIERALRRTVEDSGKEIESIALKRAVDAIGGFPFMMQLVGYRSWEEGALRKSIGVAEVEYGIQAAQHDMRARVLNATLDELSDGDVRFIAAMVEDEGASRLADIAQRMGVSGNYAAQYRRRLIENGVIGPRGRGKIDFELPGMRNYVREQLVDF